MSNRWVWYLGISALMIGASSPREGEPLAIPLEPHDDSYGCAMQRCSGMACVSSGGALTYCQLYMSEDWTSVYCQTEPCMLALPGR